MALSVLSFLVALACAAAGARRLRVVVDAWALDPAMLAALVVAQRDGRSDKAALLTAIRAELEVEGSAIWERELFEAVQAPAAARVALVNEQLADLDYRMREWARVPRVCASISISFGFFAATVLVARGLTTVDDASSLMLGAFDAVAAGIAGTVFCIAAHVRADAALRERAAATDKLIARLERREELG